jgi:hypothetical protein
MRLSGDAIPVFSAVPRKVVRSLISRVPAPRCAPSTQKHVRIHCISPMAVASSDVRSSRPNEPGARTSTDRRGRTWLGHASAELRARCKPSQGESHSRVCGRAASRLNHERDETARMKKMTVHPVCEPVPHSLSLSCSFATFVVSRPFRCDKKDQRVDRRAPHKRTSEYAHNAQNAVTVRL